MYVSRLSVKAKLLQRARHVVLVHGRRVGQRLGLARGVEAQPLVERDRWRVRFGDVQVEHIGAVLPEEIAVAIVAGCARTVART